MDRIQNNQIKGKESGGGVGESAREEQWFGYVKRKRENYWE